MMLVADAQVELASNWHFSYQEACRRFRSIHDHHRLQIRASVRRAALRLYESEEDDNEATYDEPTAKKSRDVTGELYGFQVSQTCGNIDQELEDYEALHIRQIVDVREFWAGREAEFPRLARLARLFLSVQPTLDSSSLPSLDSIVNFEHRSRLSCSQVTSILVARDRLHRDSS